VAGVAAAAGPEQVEARVEPAGEVVDGQRADPGGGKLDGEGEAVEGPADVTDPPQEPRAGHKLGIGGTCPVQEQPDGGAVHLLGVGSWDLQWWHDHGLLPAYGQPLATGRQHHQAGGDGNQLLGQPGDGGEEVLAVVEDQQTPGPSRPLAERVHQVHARHELDPHDPGDGVGHGAGVAERGQVHPPHRVVAVGDLLGQAGLAHPARADQGHQASGGEGPADEGQLPLPADE
jgi:hypothetical protein